ncbi:hypothetical protein [Aquirufa rosea]|uniref:Uncharacterized protein n=1 Tax=Aquirufa rosea TaxID=2509241 RepID=A0A4Q1BXS8_9BACT|nr:hypothetical protein [Aquirufa rosea]RXK47179.1 hypothetical protein ESB04_11330 [Aquirufa rosea]
MNPHDIVTENQLKITFDEASNSIIISTPCGNSIELNDSLKCVKLSDVYNNSISLNSEGIQIHSSKNVHISGIEIKLDAQTNLDLKASNDINSEALNINQAAFSQFKAQGSASAELSSSIQTTVKGAIVNIN